jgi:signal transduction histidine kinase
MAITLNGGVITHQLYPAEIFPYAALLAMGALAAARPPPISLVGLAGLLAVTSLDFLHATMDDAWFAMVVAVVAWSLGEATRTRRIAIEQASHRAVSEEQGRIARELHDVIAHSLSVIVVQAAAADDVFDERPDRARAALRAIEATGRESLGELRRVLAAVRPVGEAADAAPPPPQPGLDRLGELVGPLRAAGLQVDVRRDDFTGAAPVPVGVDLSAYRIVQEALTNTLRHAQASRAQVRVRSDAGFLDLDVLDDGRGGDRNPGSGRGILGMRERAAMLGGTLEAGPLPGGGFRVHARLPLESVR